MTILRSTQYEGLAAFTEVGNFVPLCRDRKGVVTREVASARFALPLPDHPGQSLPLTVALIRDLRTQVSLASSGKEADNMERWDADLEGTSRLWWRPDWVASPAPAAPTEPRLIPIVTTASSLHPLELVQEYTHRWPAQENNLRDFLLSLGLDTNYGYAKLLVENSEAAKDRAVLERKLAKVQRRRKQHASAERRLKRARALWRSGSNGSEPRRRGRSASAFRRGSNRACSRSCCARSARRSSRRERPGWPRSNSASGKPQTPSLQPTLPASGPANRSATC